MRVFNFFLLLLIFFSCKNNSLSENKIKEITNYFEAESVYLNVDSNIYSLIVNNSNLKSPYLIEQFSNVTALNLYQVLVKRKPEMEFDTKFSIEHIGDYSKKFSYKLSFLSSIDYGISSIENVVYSLKEENKILLDSFYINPDCNVEPIIAEGIEWMKIQNMDLISFESAEFNLCEETITTVLFRMNLHPLNEIIWIYYYLEEDKIIAIVGNV